jgi:MFS family permease
MNHAGRQSRLGPFAHRGFTAFWIGGFISNIGTWLQTVAASVYVFQITGSAFAVGVLNFASFLPVFLFSLVGGVVGDRFDRRLVVIVTHSTSVVFAAILAVVSFSGGASELDVIVIAFALNTSWAIAKPAYVSIVPAIVPKDQITEAVGLNTLQFVIGQMVGPILAAILIATVGVSWAFAVNALTYLAPMVAMAYLWHLRLGGGTASTNRKRGEVKIDVVPYVRSHRWVLFLLVGVIAISAPIEVIRTLSPALAQALGSPASDAGLIVAAQSIGSAIALLAFIPIQRAGRSRQLAGLGLAIQAVGIVATFLAQGLALALAGGALMGFGFSLCFPVLTSTLQAEVPDGVRGRVMALHQMSHLGNRPFAALAAGVAAVAIGVQPATLIGLVLTPIGFVAARRAWRGLDADHARGEIPPAEDAATAAAAAAAAVAATATDIPGDPASTIARV